MNLSTLILYSLAAGIAFGSVLNAQFPQWVTFWDGMLLSPIGAAFLRLIQFVVVPIVFSSLVLGLTRVQGAGAIGRYALKLLLCFVLTSAIALGVGMLTAVVLQPGAGVTGFVAARTGTMTEPPSLVYWLVGLIPVNPLEALGTGNLLQIIFTAILLGIGVQRARESARPFLDWVESVYVISEKTLSAILYVAPVGVFALIASVMSTQGLTVISKLLLYILGLAIASGVMILVDLVILWALRAEPRRLLYCLRESLSLGFGTASSNAALPMVLQDLEERYGLSPEIVRFAIPLGTALKRDGAALLQGFNALFVTQIYQIPPTPSLLLAIAVSSLLVSFSTPGVPGAALITMATVLSASGLPLEAIALVAGIDRITDGLKTVVNILGNSTNAILLSRWESVPQAPVAEPSPGS
ncbi:MAG: dicarboxylate/amino acid:cation symporter [Oscillatoriales cyanobacterium SM2_2_1]|nr:dicarboxylate/amino acid:cation symporter [Oscillatoriales cyanobacterium SM2_2_1]